MRLGRSCGIPSVITGTITAFIVVDLEELSVYIYVPLTFSPEVYAYIQRDDTQSLKDCKEQECVTLKYQLCLRISRQEQAEVLEAI